MPSADTGSPSAGELWSIQTADGHTHGIYLGDGMWNVLVRKFSEYTLHQFDDVIPVELSPITPMGGYWEHHFDALAAAEGLNTTWAQEISKYRVEGLARSINSR